MTVAVRIAMFQSRERFQETYPIAPVYTPGPCARGAGPLGWAGSRGPARGRRGPVRASPKAGGDPPPRGIHRTSKACAPGGARTPPWAFLAVEARHDGRG